LRQNRFEEVRSAVLAKLRQLFDKGVFEFLKPNQKPKKTIPIIMLQKEKYDSLGQFLKVKARGVVLGNLQEEMENFLKEAPTASMQAFYLIIFLAAKLNIRLQSKDVTGAFLNADLAEDEAEYVLLSKKHTDILVKAE
jgi:hypothetical protein